MRKVDLNVNIRNSSGNRQTVKLRREDKIPAVLYGKNGSDNTLLKINFKDISNLVAKNGENVVVELHFGSESVPAVIKEVQRSPVDRNIIHVDFQPVTLHEVIHAEVPIVIVNGSRVEKNGWVINKQIGAVEVEGEVENIPQSIKLDVSKLRIGDVLKVSDLEVAQELSILTEKDNVVLSIRAFKEEPLDLEFDRTEPELITKEEK
ncbi:MAG: 50S ribosomal protein L25 [Bacillota bacterium]